eukprot:XP_014774663.1 PREDICTED: apoptosis-inducing factor 3-like [Octopus bimaculoides]
MGLNSSRTAKGQASISVNKYSTDKEDAVTGLSYKPTAAVSEEPSLSPSPSQLSEMEVIVGPIEDLQLGLVKEVAVGDQKVLVVKEKNGVFAFGSKCTHYGLPLANGAYCNGRIRCPFHGACFDVKTGDIEDFPGLDSLHTFKVTVEDAIVKLTVPQDKLKEFRRVKPMVKYSSATNEVNLLVGGGPASLICAETLRQEGFTGKIILASKEECIPYDRPKLSKRLAKIIIQQVLPEITIPWLITAVTVDIEENLKIFEAYQTKKENWSRMTMELLIQTTQKNVDLIPDHIVLSGDRLIPVRVVRRKAKCHACFSTNHLKTRCPRLKENERLAPLFPTPTTATKTPATTAAAPSPSSDSAMAPPTLSFPKHFSASEDTPLPDAEQMDITGEESDCMKDKNKKNGKETEGKTSIWTNNNKPYPHKNLDGFSEGVFYEQMPFLSLTLIDTNYDLEVDLLVNIDSEKKIAIFKDGTEISYTKLLLATGGNPRSLEIPGNDLQNVCFLRTPSEANYIATESKRKNVVIIGSSFIGMEVAAAILEQAKSVTVICLENLPFKTVLGNHLAEKILQLHIDKGVKFQFNTSAAELKGKDGKLVSVVLANGEELPADVCVVGIGVTPATAYLEGTPLQKNSYGFVCVNEYMQTNVEGIYAAGDITEFPLFLRSNNGSNVQHWQMAHAQGKNAALNMLGKNIKIRSVPCFWTMMFGKSIRYAGYGKDYNDIVVHGDDEKIACFYTKGEEILAVASLNHDPIVAKVAEIMAEGKMLTKNEIVNKSNKWLFN